VNGEKEKTEVMLEQMNARLNQPQTRFESEIREAPALFDLLNLYAGETLHSFN
jgi:hypothetical protein